MALSKPLPPSDLRHVLTQAEGIFRELDGARIFITGGTGFFGIWLLESLSEAVKTLGLDLQATVLTRDPARITRDFPHLADLPWLTFLAGDIRDFPLPAGAFSHCIHAATAASAQLSKEQPFTMYDTCLAGTRRALEFAAGSGVGRFLLTSSGAVHGTQPPHLTHVPEDYPGGPDPLQPSSCYAEGKRASEHLCSLFAQTNGLQPLIARCWAFVGPHLPLDAHFAAGNFLRNALHGETIRIAGDGTAERSYLYAADLAIWLWTLLVKAPPLRPYNVGSGNAVSIRALADAVAGLTTPPLPVEVAGIPIPGAVPSRYVPDVARAGRELALGETISLHESLQRTLAWHRL